MEFIKNNIEEHIYVNNTKNLPKPSLFRYPYMVNIFKNDFEKLKSENIYLCKIYAYTYHKTECYIYKYNETIFFIHLKDGIIKYNVIMYHPTEEWYDKYFTFI